MTRILNLEKWQREDLQNYHAVRGNLRQAIYTARTDRDRLKALTQMAEFYFARGFGAETLGVLQMIVEENPSANDEPAMRLMRGASSLLMGRYIDAAEDLNHTSLDDNDEGAFWRAALRALAGDLPGSAYDLRMTGAVTRPYPKPLKMPMATLVAEAAIELGDVNMAAGFLEVLTLEGPNPLQQNMIDFVSGKLKVLSGDFDGAISDWEKAMDGPHRPSRAFAALARTELLLKLERYGYADAIEEMEQLRFAWRGDTFEFNLLNRLGDTYINEGEYREGLRALRQAVTYFSEDEDTAAVTQRLAEVFQSLYLGDLADNLAPVTAIALYDEFRELVPAGPDGDRLVRKVADRLVAVDLLDRAALILENQIEFRLRGIEKSQVGARLALVYIFDYQFQSALDTLDKSAAPNETPELADKRLMLRARALIGLDQGSEALALLSEDESLEADEIRASVYWRGGEWKNAARALSRLARDAGARPRKSLDERQSHLILSLAIALTLDQNESGVARLRANYGPAMAQTGYADVFQLIAEPPGPDLIDYTSVADIVKGVESFQNYMEIYRQQIRDGQLSSLY